ncbi:hypothetical protein Toil_gp01 [Rhodococcus phage Toil]|uniref:Uncharacterized protein n=1 Tax=Rhodococcus phage Toil TaxID=1975614 RepID=A0A1W6DXP9_9VIRU|nr:hypothetical protein KMD62_gp01 [Rhodococcus phage Toil]ARK07684.1 hypothetical protein Toil_gp01 [Rhodococcus phage Toil]
MTEAQPYKDYVRWNGGPLTVCLRCDALIPEHHLSQIQHDKFHNQLGVTDDREAQETVLPERKHWLHVLGADTAEAILRKTCKVFRLPLE